MKRKLHFFALLMIIICLGSCGANHKNKDVSQEESPSMVRKYNDNGTLSSINPVDEKGYVDGVKINYYEDGKTIHSKITYDHGRKHGPALWYYKNGQVHEHTSFNYGRKQGLTKKYFPTGELMEELTYEKGEVQPDAKKFNKQGQEIK